MEHKQPTAEELEAENKRILDQIEKEEKDNTPEEDEEEIPEEKEEEKDDEEPSPSDSDDSEDTEDDEEEKEEEQEEKKEEVKTEEKTAEQIELEKKEKQLKESTKEGQRLYTQKQIIEGAFDKIGDIPEPTEEEMKAKYSEWDKMTTIEKELATDNLWNKKKLEVVTEASKEVKEHDVWIKKVKDFVDDPQTLIDSPELEGKVDEFRVFAGKPTRRDMDLKDLILAFNGEVAKNSKPAKKGKMFETGGGGIKEKKDPNAGKISIADSMILRDKNYPEYKRMLEAGKIADY